MGQLYVSKGQYDGYEVILKGATNYEVDADIDVNSFDEFDIGELRFASTGTPTASTPGISSITGDLYYNCQSGDSHFFRENGSTILEIDADGIDIRVGWLEMTEISAPSGLSNHMRLYAEDNGAGKTRAMIQFGSGAAQQIALEP